MQVMRELDFRSASEPISKGATATMVNQKNMYKSVKDHWTEGQDSNECKEYFESADSKEWINTFWSKTSLFYLNYSNLKKEGNLLELACGQGRHSERFARDFRHITVCDPNETNIAITSQRLIKNETSNFNAFICNGSNLEELADKSFETIICYDAMVHFEQHIVWSYLTEFKRILKDGGQILIHHSSLSKLKLVSVLDYRKNPGMRNYLDQELLELNLAELGFRTLSKEIIQWDNNVTDALTLLTV